MYKQKIKAQKHKTTNLMLFNTINTFIFLIRPLLEARAKNVKNFVVFLGYEKTRLFAFEIY